jgi:hypothetical protein
MNKLFDLYQAGWWFPGSFRYRQHVDWRTIQGQLAGEKNDSIQDR